MLRHHSKEIVNFLLGNHNLKGQVCVYLVILVWKLLGSGALREIGSLC